MDRRFPGRDGVVVMGVGADGSCFDETAPSWEVLWDIVIRTTQNCGLSSMTTFTPTTKLGHKRKKRTTKTTNDPTNTNNNIDCFDPTNPAQLIAFRTELTGSG